jgi:hypothetical protein
LRNRFIIYTPRIAFACEFLSTTTPRQRYKFELLRAGANDLQIQRVAVDDFRHDNCTVYTITNNDNPQNQN